MARSRTDFQRELRNIVDGAKVWYVRPRDNRMTYPCFVYKGIEPKQVRADNRSYILIPGYEVLFISDKEFESIWERMTERFSFCSIGAPYIVDDLFHYPFTVYY